MALPPGTYVYEFKYLGRPSNSLTPPDFYVILGVVTTDAFGNPTTSFSQPMTPAQVEALGASPSGAAATIITGIQAQMTAIITACAVLIASAGSTNFQLSLTQPTGIYVLEFLYRGQSGGGSDWHVVLAMSTTDVFGNPTTSYAGPMTPAKASAAPYNQTLTSAIASINAAIQLQINSIIIATASILVGQAIGTSTASAVSGD